MDLQMLDHFAQQAHCLLFELGRGIVEPIELKVLPDHDAAPVAGGIDLGRRDVHVQPDQV